MLDNRNLGKFICGVVEGFYGRPWTSEQRKLLFKWMNNMGLTTYMYAPKDDVKHRVYWRELYSVEEADNLTALIEAATENNVRFVYAISPGLDISFSSAKDVQFLKRKLEQVAAFGCNSFALLFDDIDPELSEADKSTFQSSAAAQVSVTNEVFEHLGQPEFFFCPTEYCSSRAHPTLSSSGYLNTVGSKLLPGIDILWTGSKVISKKITIMELEEVASVLRRPPVIWDNIHANDYDPRRLFLGPYDGRSPEIIPYLKGVLTNPNCEFEANFIALHTLGQWSKSNPTGVKKDIISENRLSPVVSDIRLETESDYGSEEDIPSRLDTRYQPKHALKTAINAWIQEFQVKRHPPKPSCAKPLVPDPTVIPPLMPGPVPCSTPIISPVLPVTPVSNGDIDPPLVSTIPIIPDNPSYLQPTSLTLVNSLVDPALSEDSDSDASSLEMEPMDIAPTTATPLGEDDGLTSDTPPCTDNLMQVEPISCDSCDKEESARTDNELNVDYEDVELLTAFFYLPFDHGCGGVQLLQDLHWLKNNAHVVTSGKGNKSEPEVTDWFEKSQRFQNGVKRISHLAEMLRKIPNEAVNYYFYPYLWDLLGVLRTCSAYVQWLGAGHAPYLSVCNLQGTVTWCTKDYREAFTSGDQEPWCFRGGIQAEFQRMLPIDGAHDLFFIRPPDHFVNRTYVYRPYKSGDEVSAYDICLRTCDDGMDGTEVFPEFPELIGDRLIGAFTTISPEYCFIVEDNDKVCGYCTGALDARLLHQKSDVAWIPAMCMKYPKPDSTEDLSPAEEVILSFHSEQKLAPQSVLSRFPSSVRLDVLPGSVEDPAMPKRLLACTLAALKTNGSTGVHVELNVGDKCMAEFYRMLGFFPLPELVTPSEDFIYLGRPL